MSKRDMGGAAKCYDCGRPYSDGGFQDLIIPLGIWKRISPTGDEGGLLCPSCICKRLHDAGISEVPGAFMSGPIESVDRTTMQEYRTVENEQIANECEAGEGRLQICRCGEEYEGFGECCPECQKLCNCAWEKGLGPNIDCPIHGREAKEGGDG